MKQIENVVIFLGLIFSTLLLAQKNDENTLEVEFAYLLKAKLDKTNSFVDEEVFLLQVLKDKAFFLVKIWRKMTLQDKVIFTELLPPHQKDDLLMLQCLID